LLELVQLLFGEPPLLLYLLSFLILQPSGQGCGNVLATFSKPRVCPRQHLEASLPARIDDSVGDLGNVEAVLACDPIREWSPALFLGRHPHCFLIREAKVVQSYFHPLRLVRSICFFICFFLLQARLWHD